MGSVGLNKQKMSQPLKKQDSLKNRIKNLNKGHKLSRQQENIESSRKEKQKRYFARHISNENNP